MVIKNIYKREDIPIAEYLVSLKDNLIKDFLDYHTDFIQGDFEKGEIVDLPTGSIDLVSRQNAWKATSMKYTYDDYNTKISPEKASHFPTAIALTKKFGDDCPISSYSILESNSIISRHSGLENREGKFIRIHIPLIVPSGDIFLEVGGEVVWWDDIFAFDNQVIHSAYNFTDHRRLVYLIDIRRTSIGMPEGREFLESRDHGYPPFNPDQYRRHVI